MAALDLILQNEYLVAIVILVGSVIVATIFNFILKGFVHSFAAKTKSDIDDRLLEAIKRPVYFLILAAGFFFALKTLSVVAPYITWVNRIFYVFVALTAALIISRTLSVLVSSWFKVKRKYEKTPRLINKIISVVIYIIALLMILSYFNVEISPLIATLGLGGLAVGLALQDTLKNFFAGLHIISDQPIGVGDFVEVDGARVKGYVQDIGWRSTRIKTLANTMTVVPNSIIANSVLINDSMPKLQTSAYIECGVAYGSNLEKVEKTTLEVANKIQKKYGKTVTDFNPLVRFHTFADSNINFTVIMRVDDPLNRGITKHEFIKALDQKFKKEKIEISWPVIKIVK